MLRLVVFPEVMVKCSLMLYKVPRAFRARKDEGVVAGLKGVSALELTRLKLKHRGQFLGIEYHGVACGCSLNDQRTRCRQFNEVVFPFSNVNVGDQGGRVGWKKDVVRAHAES